MVLIILRRGELTESMRVYICVIKATSNSDEAKLVATGVMAVSVGITSFSRIKKNQDRIMGT